jgi:glycosyltransferase involved in cell wall biosynthesis
MEKKLNLSVILPLKSAVVKDFDEYFDKCIKSLKVQKVPFNELLIVHTVEEQLVEKLKNYDKFIVKIIQVFYNDNYEKYQNIKEEIITDKVCV